MARRNWKNRKNQKSIVRAGPPKTPYTAAKDSPESEFAPVVWVGWQIRPAEKFFGIIGRTDGSVERARLERDDLKAAADIVTANKMGNGASIRGRRVRRLT